MSVLERIKDRRRALVLEKEGNVAIVVGDLGLVETDVLKVEVTRTGFFLLRGTDRVLSIDPAPDKALADIGGSDTVTVYQTPPVGSEQGFYDVSVGRV